MDDFFQQQQAMMATSAGTNRIPPLLKAIFLQSNNGDDDPVLSPPDGSAFQVFDNNSLKKNEAAAPVPKEEQDVATGRRRSFMNKQEVNLSTAATTTSTANNAIPKPIPHVNSNPRIPLMLQAVMMQSNRGEEVHVPPPGLGAVQIFYNDEHEVTKKISDLFASLEQEVEEEFWKEETTASFLQNPKPGEVAPVGRLRGSHSTAELRLLEKKKRQEERGVDSEEGHMLDKPAVVSAETPASLHRLIANGNKKKQYPERNQEERTRSRKTRRGQDP
mmetsp:Transcript_1201/g.2630  ORF Transcript_1201/g.2630 Transcript_1201/m.2630 type:complete len:275 (-) Transcript_1201:102-926(-)|eukprot:CAMPEP_0172442630 /NCGR_PEP_ID=MMETSP1065-20121228/3034_1 /TAXON_ID=265537 /ORGANISM="Amphiprora paludosa, Strain CCMP125" /LENGTH=274 /DNA_ID=CAMNT_0013192569 /DNA_START=199 /DNA_END=1023 /DNA_ORIENTATION=+